MKTQVLITAMAVGLSLTAFDAAAFGRGGGAERPDFATLDANNDGQLTMEELRNARAAMFAAADTNGDGALSAEEMTAAAQARQADRIARMIERFDENGDGQLQADEMPQRRGGDRMERRMTRAFERADADENGTLSAEEFEEMKPKGGKGHGRDDH